VASSNISQNSKEKKDLKNLGCEKKVPNDSIDRYIATSKEFAKALNSDNRKWSEKHYRYIEYNVSSADETFLLEIKPKN
jgi:hypothetical protein